MVVVVLLVVVVVLLVVVVVVLGVVILFVVVVVVVVVVVAFLAVVEFAAFTEGKDMESDSITAARSGMSSVTELDWSSLSSSKSE